jgi:hypothetical protein
LFLSFPAKEAEKFENFATYQIPVQSKGNFAMFFFHIFSFTPYKNLRKYKQFYVFLSTLVIAKIFSALFANIYFWHQYLASMVQKFISFCTEDSVK